MSLRQLLILTCLASQLVACSPVYKAPVADRSKATKGTHHIVRRGETLYSIAWRYGLDYRQLAAWNGVSRSYAIYPGQRLRLSPVPAPQKRSYKTASTSKRHSNSRPYKSHNKSAGTSVKKAPQVKKPATKVSKTAEHRIQHWLWPTHGKIIRGFSRTESGKKGIAISGRYGQRVIATAAGKVVYSGEGLLRYGKLIIIKHNETYLSAYAHNKRLLVKEGSQVRQGQTIAEMGRSGTDRTMLHFEIRKNGKPVDPLAFLSEK